jgi:Uma2 family endonuclease
MTAVAVPPVAPRLLTADEYFTHPASREPGELVRGRICVMSPAGHGHHTVIDNLYPRLSLYVRERRLGRAYGDNLGFRLDIPGEVTDTVRSPDVSFLRAERLPAGGVPSAGFVAFAPDLAVEVLSPDQTAADMDERMADYFAAGTRLFWVVNPARRTVAVHSPAAPTRWLREGDALDGGEVVPGFSVPVADLFDGIARA